MTYQMGTLIQVILIIFKFLIFSYIYYPLYKKCNIQKKILKNNKIKVICKPKSIIAFIYFLLLIILFNLFTMKVILFLCVGLLFSSLIIYDNFSPNLDNIFEKYNKIQLIIFCWKIFHSFFTIVYICTSPIYKLINNNLNKKILFIKNMLNFVVGLNSNTLDEKRIEIINKELDNLHKNNIENSNNDENKNSDMSSISEYIVKSTKIKTNKDSKSNDKIREYKYKNEEIIEKINNINSIFSENISEIEDITITES